MYALHFGTLLSVLFYFRRTWFADCVGGVRRQSGSVFRGQHSDGNLTRTSTAGAPAALVSLPSRRFPAPLPENLLEHREDYFREHIFVNCRGVIRDVDLMMRCAPQRTASQLRGHRFTLESFCG